MKSPQTSNINTKAGFTLIEMVIVISLIAVIGGFGLFFGIDSLRGYSFHSDRDTLVSTLQHARAEAMANICRGKAADCTDGGKPHGVYIDTTNRKYVIFQGATYVSRDSDQDAPIDANNLTTWKGVNEVVFAELSGDAASADSSPDCASEAEPICIIVGDQASRTSVITVNSEGQILWSN